MGDNPRILKIDSLPPLIQLIISFLIVFIAGTILFYLFIFAGSLVFGTEVDKMLLIPSSGSSLRENMILKYVQFSQQVSLFVIPSLTIVYLLKRQNETFLGMDKFPELSTVVLVIILSLLTISVTSYTGVLNSKMNLPDWLSGVENWMRTKEDSASDVTELLITSSGFFSLTVNLIILAVVPAFGEELLFRGVLQQLLCRIFRSGHFGIWITAFVFSAIHLQFFGFIPRLILGLSFGYLFFWSRNLWIPIISHFINNAVPVIISFYAGSKELKEEAMNPAEKELMIPFIQIILGILILYYFWLKFRKRIKDEPVRINENTNI